jgi:hypothetical protein
MGQRAPGTATATMGQRFPRKLDGVESGDGVASNSDMASRGASRCEERPSRKPGEQRTEPAEHDFTKELESQQADRARTVDQTVESETQDVRIFDIVDEVEIMADHNVSLSVEDVRLLLEALKYSKQAKEGYSHYPNQEFKQQCIDEVDALMRKLSVFVHQ